MELSSGDDLISLKESILTNYAPSTESAPSTVHADQYARCNGLTVDSLLFDWQQLVDHDPAIVSTLTGLAPGQLIEGFQLQECLFRVIIPTPEQWQMSVASLKILHEVCSRRKPEELTDLATQQCFPMTLKRKALKLDALALRRDHMTDCRRLARRVKAFLKEPLRDHRLPLHPVGIDNGEGLEFPSNLTQRDADQVKVIMEESLEMTRDTMVYLMQSLKSDLTDNDQRKFLASIAKYRGVGARDRLTPPLSPMADRSPEYFIPENGSCELPEPSEPSSRLSEDVNVAENRIFETEWEFWADVLEKDAFPERYDEVDVSEMIRRGEFRTRIPQSSPQPIPRDLKVDVPLLPWSDHNADAQKNFMRILAPHDLEEAKELVASSDTLSGSDGPTGQLVKAFQRSETTVTRCTEQEKLQPLDAIARVPVPVLDFSIPVPEWEQRLWQAKEMFRWVQKNTNVDWQGAKWAHSRAAEQRMVWAPLAHLKEKRLVSEQIEADVELLDCFLGRTRDGEVLTSADYVYKEPGPAVLRFGDQDDEDDDYLESIEYSMPQPPSDIQADSWITTAPSTIESSLALQRGYPLTASAETTPPTDLATLLHGRKRLLDETLEKKHSGLRENGELAASVTSAMDIIDPSLIQSTNVLRGFMSEYTDFAPLLDNFVEMNFSKRAKLAHSSFLAPSRTPMQSKANEAAKLMPPPPKPVPALAPDIHHSNVPPRIVVSSSVSTLITQHISEILPGLELIPRNYEKNRPPGWFPGMRSPNLDEADFVVSPATGILLTTMIKLRQRALPGQAAGNAHSHAVNFRHIVENVAVRHERLIVLVSEGNKHSETASPLSQSDARALVEFQGFAVGIQTADVRVVYVGGGVETLAKWLAATISEHSASEARAVREMLLPVETFWEVFLRRAGMNAFSAQVVLGRLKVPDGRVAVGGEDGRLFGLPLFVTIGRERRLELFGEVFGGRRVLDRVSDVVDEPWGQRAVGEGGFDPRMVPGWGGAQGGMM
ncbi:hypothetical protein VTI74DRAFT_11086 [Chaetomium olivicolor]